MYVCVCIKGYKIKIILCFDGNLNPMYWVILISNEYCRQNEECALSKTKEFHFYKENV